MSNFRLPSTVTLGYLLRSTEHGALRKMEFYLLIQLGLCNGPNKLLPLFLKNGGYEKIRLKLIEVE